MTDHNLESADNNLIARRHFLRSGLAALIALMSATPTLADRRRRRRGRRRRLRRRALRRMRRRGSRIENHARTAVRQGKIRPLREVMAKVQQRSDAEVLDVDLYKLPDGWVYALRLLTTKGRVRDVFLDARTLDVLRIEKPRGGVDGVPLPRPLQGPPPPLLPKKPAPIPLP